MYYNSHTYGRVVESTTGARARYFEGEKHRIRFFEVDTFGRVGAVTSPLFGAQSGPFFCSEAAYLEYYGDLYMWLSWALEGGKYEFANFHSPFSLHGFASFPSSGSNQFYEFEKNTLYLRLSKYSPPAKRAYEERRARRMGVQIRDMSMGDVVELYEIYRRDCTQKSIPRKPLSILEMIMNAQDERNGEYVLSSVALFEGKLVGGLISLCTSDFGTYYWPISSLLGRQLSTNTLLLIEHINILKSREAKVFNFESSPAANPGVLAFKKGFGPESSCFKIVGFASSWTRENVNAILERYPTMFVYPY